MKMMKSMMFGMMMCFAMSSMASTATNQYVQSGRGSHPTTMMASCQCKQCKKVRKQLDKHLSKAHRGKQNRMTCRECMKYSQMLNEHNRTNCCCNNHDNHSNCNHGSSWSHTNGNNHNNGNGHNNGLGHNNGNNGNMNNGHSGRR